MQQNKVKSAVTAQKAAITTTKKTISSTSTASSTTNQTSKTKSSQITSALKKNENTKQNVITKSQKTNEKIGINPQQNKIFEEKKQTDDKQIKNGYNIMKYLNKNCVQLIIPFLQVDEISKLMRSNKQIKSVAQQSIQPMIENLGNQRGLLMEQHKLDKQQIQAIIYLLHFDQLFKYLRGTLISTYFNEKPTCQILFMLFKLKNVDIERFQRYTKQHEETRRFYISHSINSLNTSLINDLNIFLKEYNDKDFESGKFEKNKQCKNYKASMYLQKYLKGIQMVIQLNMTQEQYDILKQIYNDHLLKIDKLIYQYQSFINKSQQETLFLFEPQNFLSFPQKYKLNPTYIFQD